MDDSWMFNKGNVINFPIPEGVQTPIYVIGDSHIRVLPEVAPYLFKSSQMDIEDVFQSKTAYIMGNEVRGTYLNNAIELIPKGSVVLLSFGEIDCRHYLPKLAISQGKTIGSLVDEVIERYTNTCVKALKGLFKVMILGVYICPDDHNHENSFGDIMEAKTLFNKKIQKYCESNGILYVPIFKKSLEEKWDRCRLEYPHYFNDTSHLGGCMIPVILDSMVNFKWVSFDY